MNERGLKKHLRKLKKLRTAVIVGDIKQYTETQLNDAIERTRRLIKLDLSSVISFDEYVDRRVCGEKHLDIAKDFNLESIDLRNYLQTFKTKRAMDQMIAKIKREKEEEKEMAKLELEQYKVFIAQGMKPKQIAEKVGISEASVYQQKSKWKKAGLLEDLVAPAPVKIEVVNDGALERMTAMYHSAQAKNEELSSKVQSLTAENEEKDKEYAQLNDVYKDLQIDMDDEIKGLINLIEESDGIATVMIEKYIEQSSRFKDSQHIAASYENHENELLEQIEVLEERYLKAQVERDKHKQSGLQEKYGRLLLRCEELEQQYSLLSQVSKPLFTEYAKII